MKVGIIGAMDVEVNLLKKAMHITRETVKAGMNFCEGKLSSTDAVQSDFDVTHIGFRAGEIPYTGKIAFEADKVLREKAVKAVHAVAPGVNVIEGRICSGDQFNSKQEVFDRIISAFKGDCIEMEAGAIAQVCYLNDIPFVSVRAISDKIGTPVKDYKKFEADTAELCASVTKYMTENF